MLNIQYSNESFLSIDSFILYLKNYYKKIYFDTWLVNENQIVLAYIEKTEKLFDEIINGIEESVNKWVFWLILETSEKYELSKLVIWVRSYNIIVIIKKTKNNILIEDIIIK